MDLKAVKDFLGEDWTRTVSRMSGALKSDIELLDSTNAYVSAHSGKQLRPMLCLLVARAIAGKVTEDTISFAAAAELLHNATLLHDDVADASDERRGQPTIYSLMGPSVSVLVGDYWLVSAMNTIVDSSLVDKTMGLFSRTLQHLAEGEMLQLQKAESGDTGYEDYLRIIYNKTASLFEVVGRTAAMSVGADDETVEAMASFTRLIGLAFQMRDDIFDYSLGLNTGKPSGIDILERKITLPLLCAFENAGKEEEKHIRELVLKVNENPAAKDTIVDFVHKNGGIEGAQSILEKYINDAVECLEKLSESREKEMLKELATYISKRSV